MSGAKRSQRSDPLEATRERAKRRAQHTAQRTAEEAKEELGRLAFETLETYFPEQAEARQRQSRWQVLLVGVALGFLLRHVMGRRS